VSNSAYVYQSAESGTIRFLFNIHRSVRR